MNIAIVGMGIIGGSFAKALKQYTNHHIIGINRTQSTLKKAFDIHAIDEMGDEKSLLKADIIILAVYPKAAVEFIKNNVHYIKKGAIVTDSSGIKTEICPEMIKLANENQFVFVGSHPMAGKETNGFDVSEADLYKGASYIIVPCEADEKSVATIKNLALSIGFSTIKITTPQEHDRMIAFTSQIPHVLACSYVMSPCCPNHKGFSAGSYRDVSRVANINAGLWSELFLENRKPLITELDELIKNITAIRNAIDSEDKEELYNLLEQGHHVKEALGE